MAPITLQPHHVQNVWLAYQRGKPGDGVSYYTRKMAETDIANIMKILENPNQLIQITSGLDSLCASCPYNRSGEHYDPTFYEDHCSLALGNPLNDNEAKTRLSWIKDLGLTKLVDGQPISSSELLKTIEKTNSSFLRRLRKISRGVISDMRRYWYNQI